MKIRRRAFLATGAVIAAIGGAALFITRPFQARQLSAAEKQACGLTVEATEGPYHVSEMPELKDGNLNFTKNLACRRRRQLSSQWQWPRVKL